MNNQQQQQHQRKSNNSQHPRDRHRSHKPSPSGSSSSTSKAVARGSAPTLGEYGLMLLAVISVVVLVGVAIYNVNLYTEIIAGYLPMPWAWLQRMVGWGLWALIQACELIPLLIEYETAFMALIAVSAGAFPSVSIGGNNPTVNKIQRRVNSFPKRWLFLAGMMGCVVFGLDLALVIGHFKPVAMNGFIPSIDMGAAFSVILTVILFQAACMICLFACNGLWFVGLGRKSVDGGK